MEYRVFLQEGDDEPVTVHMELNYAEQKRAQALPTVTIGMGDGKTGSSISLPLPILVTLMSAATAAMDERRGQGLLVPNTGLVDKFGNKLT